MSAEDRAGYIAGLRMLADLLEQHDDVPLPWVGGKHSAIAWILLDDANTFRKIVRALPGQKSKQDGASGTTLRVKARLAGIHVEAMIQRDAVCERRIVGTETVEVEEREGEDTRPIVTKTVEREIVEWQCSPLLKEAAS